MIEETIICNTCNTSYNSIDKRFEQGDSCATDVFEYQNKKISISYYGSDFDTEKYIFDSNCRVKSGNLCDSCLEKFIENGEAIKDNDFDYFNLIKESVNNNFKKSDKNNKILLTKNLF